MSSRGRSGGLAIAAGVVVTGLLVVTAREPADGGGWRLAFVAVHLAGAALSAWYVGRGPLSRRTVILGAIAFRVCALPMLPTLSDDGYRYLWDGRVSVEAGVSPYEFRPSDPELARWHGTAEYRRMNSPDYYSVYPPGSQAMFALAVRLAPGADWRAGWWTWKLLMVAAELTAILLLLRLVSPQATALYAWSPLAVVEVAGQGHTEALVLAGLAVALVATVGARRSWPVASVGLTFAGAVKLYPLGLLPVAWRREGWRGVAASAVLLGGLSALFWSPQALANAAESLGLFFGTFDEYAGPYRAVKAVLYPVLGEGAGAGASRLLALAFASGAAWTWLVDDGTGRALQRAVVVVTVGFAVASSTLHPWYGLPVLFVLPLLQSKTTWWVATWATAGYATYAFPGLDVPVLIVGWGGGLIVWGLGRYRATGRPLGGRRRPSPTTRPTTSPRDSVGTT